ncbi:DUF7683 domain-containing protein [Phyllobacterium endophyticum]|uniref:DUF7683 domain-containing protein n=1 Tax=Phyllobacterium endophyticum TaxID=1149773 RepID=UPI003CCE95A0
MPLYEKEGEDLVNKFEFLCDDLEFFRSILDYPKDDPLLYDVYQINADQNLKIFERFGVMVDVDKYDCFVDYYE